MALYLLDHLMEQMLKSKNWLEIKIHLYCEIMNRNDEYLILKDFDSYLEESKKIEEYYLSKDKWYASSVVNIAKSGYFSSDRTIEQYNEDIWHLEPIKFN